ncbi:Endopolyphosphatase [Corynespora cassiicola Philippines]|uniref:Endopolyphosphatase n=1 Tax=Corynespora cassiicola Philippines TaxID=1448308 RepID=A0A2T2P5S7_CORCC|nr:Endopolyphosphatase [Corynespora cassiicola Philippines]
MLKPRDALIWGLCALPGACRAAPQSGAGTGTPASGVESREGHSGRRLQGRFLHITDFHPDPFYKTYAATSSDAACHRKRGPAGVYGAETSGCDSPYSLVNETFKWIDEHIKDKVDFVVWTGDSARHDNDEKIPRTQKQIIKQNEFVVSKFAQVFGNQGSGHDSTSDYIVPIVPTFGNNDIMPHNIFLAGPNKWTMKYLDIWRDFIPEAQRHQFQQGGWFYKEVIPGKLAVISLNTMYFFDSNSGVDGCADKKEPGYEHMEWLRIQLQLMREQGLKAILIGHVPPARVDSKESWDETCWQKFTLWERQYRDVIVTSLFGHMNIDHFMLQDFKQLKKSTKKGRMASASSFKTSADGDVALYEDGEVTLASASDYLLDLGAAWAKLPVPPKSKGKSLSEPEDIDDDEQETSVWQRLVHMFSSSNKGTDGGKSGKSGKSDKKKYLDKIGGKYAERYSVSLVSPSVVPNYFPTLRIFEYDITGLEGIGVPAQNVSQYLDGNSVSDHQFSDDESYQREVNAIIKTKQKKKEKELKKRKKYKFKIPEGPSKSSPPGPAYSVQPLSLLGYVQYFANLTRINNDFVDPKLRSISVNENSPRTIFGLEIDEDGNVESNKWKEGKHRKHQGKKPRPKPHPKKFNFEIEYDTRSDKRWKLKDLTVRSYVDLARRIGHDRAGKKAALSEEDYELSESEDDEDHEDLTSDLEDELDSQKKGKKKKGKKKHGKKHHKHNQNGPWYTFVRRAFVSTMDAQDIEEMFGFGFGVEEGPHGGSAQEQEVLEL